MNEEDCTRLEEFPLYSMNVRKEKILSPMPIVALNREEFL
jgi:hypothetical protein